MASTPQTDFWDMATLVVDQQLDAVWRRGVQDALDILPATKHALIDEAKARLVRLRDRGPRVPPEKNGKTPA